MVASRSRWTLGAVGLATVATLVAGCGSSDDGATTAASDGAKSTQVVASTNVYGDIVKQIAGDSSKVEITSIISDPSQDPHSYEANTQTQLKLSKADLVIENGGGYDDFMDTMLKSANNGDATVLNAVEVSGKTAPADGELNEHVWYDLPSIEKLVPKITEALSAADTSEKATFEANAKTFLGKVQQLESAAAAIKAKHNGEGAAITEPVPVYLLQASGLVDKTPEEFSEAVEEGTDVPAAVLQETLGLFTAKQVKVLAYNEQTAGPESDKVVAAAKSAGVPVVAVTETLPPGKDYVSWMSGMLSSLQTALG
ncbi:metal ABC transporter solute-binding protein, Zn/Mn family [Cryptosporangium arvum]|uniref:ABC-type metal ion transport system, periplasmic component/surface adhesin n=1 Tax=Cryptosporangium arvum DSM 44712 TaxID=927661 RepID=A0A010YZ49_9ACTN|nr:zinc ABC transporter substrate-binding protein [Cryptosporangium arvum]EXG80503.1 ABC-type metal ion transport system, periplasmic component/surface adhesin [Cryptosporangium arvum DSM 44712]